MKESYTPGLFDRSRIDEKINILDEDAFEMARRLAREEGILAGMSSGAAMHVALEKAKSLDEGHIVVIFPDSAERYLSTELFAAKEKTSVRFYNTLTRTKEFFQPISAEQILMHTCGPTVHLVPHIGSYRRFVVSDLIMRYLESKGHRVKHVISIVDLADRAIKGADRADMDLKEFTDQFVKEFFRDIERLNIRPETLYPRASDNVQAMVEISEKLASKGFAYDKLRSLYFDISKLEDYGRLSNIDLRNIRHEITVEKDDYEKDSPGDFALLKRSTLAELKRGVFVKTRWGNVRPSWHLECAAISLKYLADLIDIHVSGSDLVFPHCEDVRAIGEAVTGKPLANYWLNAELVMIRGKKMSRSLENVFTLEELQQKGYGGKDIRFFLLASHYRKPLNFSFGALDTARFTLSNLNAFIQRLIRNRDGTGSPDMDQHLYDLRNGFTESLDDDLNISGALAYLFEFVNKANGPLARGEISSSQRDQMLTEIKQIDSVLGVLSFEEEVLSKEAQLLMLERERARKKRDWPEADRLRSQLFDTGIIVEDTAKGPVWRKK